jgi:hypothetical protein
VQRTNLDREEYIEQAYFFRALAERLKQNSAAQELLVAIREEVLSTTKLPLAIDFMASELRHHGVFATAMAKLGHYFTPFQTFLVSEAENERGRFDLGVALRVLYEEANYRTGAPTQSGIFVFQFETISRNRLGYDRGLTAVADDPIFDNHWRTWILSLRRQIGIVDFADLVYVNSEHYFAQRRQRVQPAEESAGPPLFGEQEGRIALANRRKDPLLLFSALQRHLGYPVVPRPQPIEDPVATLRSVGRRIDKLELRLKLLEDEQRGGIDLSKFYTPKPEAGAEPEPL